MSSADVPYGETIRTSYENFVARCPSCGHANVFNRATDLKAFGPIALRTVACLHDECGRPFKINGDSINSAHEMFIYDSYELLDQKRYMGCILSLAQAWELFFSLFLRVELLYKPFAADPDMDIDRFNALAKDLSRRLGGHTFDRMRALVLLRVTADDSIHDMDDAERAIGSLPAKPRPPRDSDLDTVADERLRALLKAVKRTTLNRLRNQVIHKRAYRPTRAEAESAIEETRSVLFPLTARLGLQDDINWYVGQAKDMTSGSQGS